MGVRLVADGGDVADAESAIDVARADPAVAPFEDEGHRAQQVFCAGLAALFPHPLHARQQAVVGREEEREAKEK